ncbi:MAG TPA: hypothetical protein VGL82_12130 [Bryobacteraceae bacterium]
MCLILPALLLVQSPLYPQISPNAAEGQSATAAVPAPAPDVASVGGIDGHALLPAEPGSGVDTRIFGVSPNFRIAEGTMLFGPITTKPKFTVATKDTFNYPSYMLTAAFSELPALAEAPDTPAAPDTPDPDQAPTAPGASDTNASDKAAQPAAASGTPIAKQQPKRILGIMPNYRAVSAGTIPPPPTPLQALKIATQNSFDYSAFVFVGVTSLLAEGTNAHPALGKGVSGFAGYYWRGYLDKTDGNYLVIFAMPTIFHQDERYYAKGEGGFWKRGIYAASRVLITPNYHGHATFNASEVFGRAAAQGISIAYYPRSDRTVGDLASKYAYALGRDALTNVFREFWPDIATHVLHRHP